MAEAALTVTESGQPVNSISIIDSINLAQVQATMAKINQFQTIVQKTLKQNHDFGVIPGTPKPTLLKPGAEKILMLMGLTSEYEIVEKVQDYEGGFFAFTVKCTLSKGDTKITEGIGHANTRERRYVSGRNQDPFTLANTVLKMAKKRSQVDAVLTVASLSDIFTQDLEDMDLEGASIQQSLQNRRVATDQSGKITTQQAKRMFAIAKGEQEIVRQVLNEYGYQSSTEVDKVNYDKICARIEALVAEKGGNNEV